MQPAKWNARWKLWAAAVLSAALLELPFPLAGPLPAWRTVIAWFGLVPLLWAVLKASAAKQPRPLRRGFLLAYLCGVLWFMGNCYWIRNTMMHYGDMPRGAPTLLLVGFSLVLGLYFGLFGLGVAMVRRATGDARQALAIAPLLWVALELAAARITSVPWDQLGYSQVDNTLVNQLAPWTGVYGISFVLVAVNALIAGGVLLDRKMGRRVWGAVGAALLLVGGAGVLIAPAKPEPSAEAVLIQPNLDVGSASNWTAPGEWDAHMAQFAQLAGESAKSDKLYIAGIPQTGAPTGEMIPPPYATHPDLVVWPESPAPFDEADPRFMPSMAALARQVQAPLVVGGIGEDVSGGQLQNYYNSALVIGADGQRVGRQDKIHLVPFGEYIPFQQYLTFAHKLTGRVSTFSRGDERKVFRLNGHRYGIFICYESVFADEVREFAELGAEVLVNISDDGWYGDTSAPWQHLNMVRMRAIENRRWILRDTNTGVTAVIDPEGSVRQSIPRHQLGELPAQYGFRDDITYYTLHGDVFAWACAILGLGAVGGSARRLLGHFARRKVHNQVRS
jgi:apolipoprotein N-acyltransferase